MECPHCNKIIQPQTSSHSVGSIGNGKTWEIHSHFCPGCKNRSLDLVQKELRPPQIAGNKKLVAEVEFQKRIYPIDSRAKNFPDYIPEEFIQDYNESCVVLPFSRKASAALSRRCLQGILRSLPYIKKGSLADEIQQFIDKREAPSYLLDSIDAIRNIGNFAAHPMKSQQSDSIADVEEGEAEWSIDVLESLFDVLFIQPKKLEEKKNDLNKKLEELGKPPLK